MRWLAFIAVAASGGALTACGGSTVLQHAGTLELGGSGVLRDDTFNASADISGRVAAPSDFAPSSFSFTMSAADRSVTADLDAVAAAWAGRDLRTLDGSELTVSQTLTGMGSFVTGGQVEEGLPFTYSVQSYAPPAEPLLTLAFTGEANGASATGTLTISLVP
jgi:hypothetical protein